MNSQRVFQIFHFNPVHLREDKCALQPSVSLLNNKYGLMFVSNANGTFFTSM